jgi:hypothetical protein
VYAAAKESKVSGYSLLSPSGQEHKVDSYDLEDVEKYEKLVPGSAQKLWDRELKDLPAFSTRKHFIITGAVFPIYDKVVQDLDTGAGLQHTRSRVVRAVLPDGESYIGIDIDERDIIGVKQRLGIGAPLAEATPSEVFDLADFNVGVGHQPHSEVAALAVLLDRIFNGSELKKEFKKWRLRIIPRNKGKKVEKKL